MRTISIVHPSRSRPLQAKETIEKWLSRAKFKKNIQYILSFDTSDANLITYETLSDELGINACSGSHNSAIEAINHASSLSTGDIIIVVSDDFNNPPHDWDDKLLNEISDREDFLLKTKDGLQKTLVTLPIMDRYYYNRFGYVYYGGYKHLFSDQEMTTVAIFLGKLIYSDLEFPHNHYSTGKTKKDVINIKNDKTWEQGKELFNRRLKRNFGLETTVKYSDIQWK